MTMRTSARRPHTRANSDHHSRICFKSNRLKSGAKRQIMIQPSPAETGDGERSPHHALSTEPLRTTRPGSSTTVPGHISRREGQGSRAWLWRETRADSR